MRESNVLINDVLMRAEERIELLTGLKVMLTAMERSDNQLQSIEDTINAACYIWRTNAPALVERSRKQPLPTMRSVLSLLLKNNFPNLTLNQIAQKIGVGDHTTALYNITQAQAHLSTGDQKFLMYYNPVKSLFKL